MATEKKAASARTPRPEIAPQARALEWGFGVVSGILVTLLLGYLAYEGIRTQAQPSFTVEIVRTDRLGSGHHVAIELTNAGDVTAADVTVRGVVGTGADAETSETVIDFVPPRSTKRSVLVFAREPVSPPKLSVRSYNEP